MTIGHGYGTDMNGNVTDKTTIGMLRNTRTNHSVVFYPCLVRDSSVLHPCPTVINAAVDRA